MEKNEIIDREQKRLDDAGFSTGDSEDWHFEAGSLTMEYPEIIDLGFCWYHGQYGYTTLQYSCRYFQQYVMWWLFECCANCVYWEREELD